MVVALVAAGFIGYKYAVRYKWLPWDQSNAQVISAEVSKPLSDQGVQTTDVKKPAPVLAEPMSSKEDAGASPAPAMETPPAADVKVASGPATTTIDPTAVSVKTPTETVGVLTPAAPAVAAAPNAPQAAITPLAAAPARVDSPVVAVPTIAVAPVAQPRTSASKSKPAETTSRKIAKSSSSPKQDDTWNGASRIF